MYLRVLHNSVQFKSVNFHSVQFSACLLKWPITESPQINVQKRWQWNKHKNIHVTKVTEKKWHKSNLNCVINIGIKMMIKLQQLMWHLIKCNSLPSDGINISANQICCWNPEKSLRLWVATWNLWCPLKMDKVCNPKKKHELQILHHIQSFCFVRCIN